MTLFLPHTTFPSHNLPRSSPLRLVNCSFKSRAPTNASIPARDRVIDFGKHKGKMLGTLPSSYLKWVSNNLRARDFEEWANLADHVLQDPVYKDRIEWEFAENLLTGNNNNIISLRNGGAVSELLEISERFGWDNTDKVGWSRVSFELLGTSKGGRIPRVSKNGGKERELGVNKREKVGDLSKGEERRRERRERMRMKMKTEVKKESRDGVGDDSMRVRERDRTNIQDGMMENCNPFPGREALFKKVLNHKRSL